MWKPVNEWMRAEKMEFFYLLTGFKEKDFLAEYFFILKSFMEKELSKVWEGYLRYIAKLFAPLDYCSDGTFRMVLNKQLDLTNLIQYLLDNRGGWGWKECPECKGQALNGQPCNTCDGDGMVKNPALMFAEGVK